MSHVQGRRFVNPCHVLVIYKCKIKCVRNKYIKKLSKLIIHQIIMLLYQERNKV